MALRLMGSIILQVVQFMRESLIVKEIFVEMVFYTTPVEKFVTQEVGLITHFMALESLTINL